MRTLAVVFGWTALLGSLWAQGLWLPQSMLNDASTLNVQVIRQWTETIDLRQARVTEIRYNSWEVVDGNLVVIPIEAYYAIPTSVSGRVGAVVMAHGLGGAADGRSAARFALEHNVGALYYSGLGCGHRVGDRSRIGCCSTPCPIRAARGSGHTQWQAAARLQC